MPRYSVAETKDKLSALIDKALAGEEVVITRRGRATVRMVPDASAASKSDPKAFSARLQRLRESGPRVEIPLNRFYEWLYEDEE